MKKFFVAVICFVIFSNFSTCQAVNVRLVDEGVETFYSSVSNLLSMANSQTDKPNILLSKLSRTANLDIPAMDWRTWLCAYYLEGYSEPIGEIIFLVNGQGYVSDVKVVTYYKQAAGVAGFIIGAILFAVGMTPDEIDILMNKIEDNSDETWSQSVWSKYKDRNFVLMKLPRIVSDDGIQCLIMATK